MENINFFLGVRLLTILLYIYDIFFLGNEKLSLLLAFIPSLINLTFHSFLCYFIIPGINMLLTFLGDDDCNNKRKKINKVKHKFQKKLLRCYYRAFSYHKFSPNSHFFTYDNKEVTKWWPGVYLPSSMFNQSKSETLRDLYQQDAFYVPFFL